MPRKNARVRDKNRDRARKHAHRHDTQMPQYESRAEGVPTWQHVTPSGSRSEKRLYAYVPDK